MLCFVVFHGDFEHIIAANAYAMDFRRRLFARPDLCGMLGVLIMLRLAHERILARSESYTPLQLLIDTH
jgi:hypothetical protein